jgi:uncharacterized protein (TIRG00374 family)
MKRRWRLWLGLAISAAFLYVTLRGLSLGEVLSALQGANYLWLLPGIVAYFLAVWARTWRWHYMLRPLKSVPLRVLFPVVTIGYMGNNIYPARAGEVLRAYILKRQEGIPISANLATVLVERIFDGLVMLLFVFVTLPFTNFGAAYQNLVILTSAAFLGALIVFLVLAARRDWAEALFGWAVGLVVPVGLRPRAQELFARFMDGLASLRSGRDVLMIFATSTVVWLLETVKYWFVMHAFHFSVPFTVLMLMNGIANLATTLPAAPGHVGTFEVGIGVLVAFGVEQRIAAGYTLVLHAALWLPITLLGAYYLWKARLSWDRVQEDLAHDSEAQKLNLVGEDEGPGVVAVESHAGATLVK